MAKDLTPLPDADEARNVLIQIVTAARQGDMPFAKRLANEYQIIHTTILPLFISSLALIETVLKTVSEEMEMDADTLWQGIALGLTIKQMEAKNQREDDDGES